MASKKFMDALNLLIEEKGIEKDVFLEMLKESIGKAYKKNYLNPDANVRVEINEKTGKFRLFELRTVVDDLDDEDIEFAKLKKKHFITNLQIKKMISSQVSLIVLRINLQL